MNNEQNQIFRYNGSSISFQKGDSVMVNATEMAKPFGKRPVDWLQNQQAKEFITALAEVRKSTSADLVKVTKGGYNKKGQGTWMHEDVALEFARWLSPMFAIWCNDRIKELLTKGHTEIHQIPEPSEPVLTSTFDISSLTGRPHDRIMKDIRKILEQGAGADDFIPIFRPVQTESGMKEYESYDITPKGLLTLATGYPPLLRDRIAARYAELTGGGSAYAGAQPACRNRTEKAKAPEAEPEEKKSGPDRTKGGADPRLEMEFLKERIRRMEKQLRRLSLLPETPNEDIFRQFPQYHSVSVPMPTPDDLYNSMTFDNVRKKLYCDLGIEFSPISLSKYLEAHGFVTNEGKDRLKPTKKAVDDNWILYPVEIPDEEDGIRLWRPKFTERGYMILVGRIRDYGAFKY